MIRPAWALAALAAFALTACSGDGAGTAADMGAKIAADKTSRPLGKKPPVPGRRIGNWSELILAADGSIDPIQYRKVAARYNAPDIMDYRLGPTAADFGNPANTAPALWGPDASGEGLWSFGTQPTANPGEPAKCASARQLPTNETEEAQRGMRGNAWLVGGQHLFLPDDPNHAYYRFGISNTRGADGVVFDTGGLCLRMKAGWFYDWWTRNNIASPDQPNVRDYAAQRPDLPLVPIAIARARANASQHSFAAFRDGTIIPVSVGNSGGYNVQRSGIRLPAGMVPTAMAVTPYNEFLVVTVWDTNDLKGKLAFIALRPRQMACCSAGEPAENRHYWGFPGAWTFLGIKYLGTIDLPFQAPSSVDVSNHAVLGNPRGYQDNNDPAVADFARQSARDRWRNVAAQDVPGDFFWQQNARAGYAVVASRAENKVAFIDMEPLYRHYRAMYLTTPANYAATQDQSVTDPARFPYAFANRPEQRPVVATVIDVPQPTSVNAGVFTKAITGVPRAYDLDQESRASGGSRYPQDLGLRQAYVASMDGTVRFFDVTGLIFPGTDRTVPTAPLRTVTVGRNPNFLYTNSLSTAFDDIFLVSRGDRSVSYIFPNGTIAGTLRDGRLIDPVAGAVSINIAGFGGAGAGRAVASFMINITDYNGRAIHTYGVDGLRYGPQPEAYPFTTPTGRSVFLFGSTAPFPGKPFMIDMEEII